MKLKSKFFQSSTLNTWFAFAIKSINIIFFIPLIFATFSKEESELWLLFSVFLTLQNVADFGFYNTFVRVISYAYGGVSKLSSHPEEFLTSKEPNIELLKRIIGTMNKTYFFMLFIIFLIGGIGTIVVFDRINDFNNPEPYFVSWAIFILGMSFNFYGRIYSNFLYGVNLVYLVRRWEGIFSVFSTLSNLVVLIYFKSFFLLACSYQFWIMLNIFRNKYLASHVLEGLYFKIVNKSFDKGIFDFVWPMAWRSGVSSVASTGMLSFSGIWFSTLDNVSGLNQYLYTVKMLDAIRTFSKAPFYSKIPYISKLRGTGELTKWVELSFRSVTIGNWFFIVVVIVLEIFGDLFLTLLNSQVDFPSSFLWLGLGFGYYFHINGAYHSHLYMSANKVNVHINDIISGLIFSAGAFYFVNLRGVHGFVYAEFMAYGLFYFWYSIFYSKRLVNNGFFHRVFVSTVVPLIILFIFMLISLFIYE